MCCGCWEEAGRPWSTSWITRHVARLVDRLYEDHETGGPLHVLTDDWNTDASTVWYCLKSSWRGEAAMYPEFASDARWPARYWRGVRLCAWFLVMSERRRIATLAYQWPCAEVPA